MKRLRMWFWRSLADLFALLATSCRIRRARACGCEACRLQYDQAFREQTIRNMFGLPSNESASADRRPS